VPYGGFKEFRIRFQRSSRTDRLPVAHTCFNRIEIPDYADKETLNHKLMLAISESEQAGFLIV